MRATTWQDVVRGCSWHSLPLGYWQPKTCTVLKQEAYYHERFTICVAALTFRSEGKGFAIATGCGILNKHKWVRKNDSSSRSQVLSEWSVRSTSLWTVMFTMLTRTWMGDSLLGAWQGTMPALCETRWGGSTENGDRASFYLPGIGDAGTQAGLPIGVFLGDGETLLLRRSEKSGSWWLVM